MRILFDFDEVSPDYYASRLPRYAILDLVDLNAIDSVCRAIYHKISFHLYGCEILDICDRQTCDGDIYKAYKYRCNFNNESSESLTMYIYIPVVVDDLARKKIKELLK